MYMSKDEALALLREARLSKQSISYRKALNIINKMGKDFQLIIDAKNQEISALKAQIEKMKCCENCKSYTNVGSNCLLDMEDSLGCRANDYLNWKLKDNE